MSTAFQTRQRLLASACALVVAGSFSSLNAQAQTPQSTSAASPDSSASSASGQTSAPAAAPAVALPTTQVNDSTVSSPMQTKTLPSYKFVAPLRDTPRSITVIPEELIKQTNATTFADALKTVPGITFIGGDAAANPSADRPVIRGFESRNSIFVDGMRDSGVQNRETFDIENISVIKGPDSVYAGRGAVGGSIDITTKTPRLEDFTNASLGLGTDSYKRLTMDVNRQVNDQTAVRLNVMGHDADQAGRNNVYSKRWGVAPSVAFGLNSPTTVTVSYYHLNSYDMPDFSAPFRSAGGTPDGGFQRNQFYGLNNRDYRRGQTDTGEIKVEHRINDTWKIKNTTMVGRATLDYIATNPQFQSATSNIISLQAKSGKYATNSIANQTELTGKATLFGFEHTLTGGVEFSNEQSRYEGYLVTDRAGNNIRSGGPCSVAYNCTTLGNWNPDNPWTGSIALNGDKSFPGAATNTRTNVASAYLFDSVKLSDRWLINAGARFDRFDVSAVQAGAPDLKNTSNLFSFQLGVIYKVLPSLSLYASYGTSANPPGANSGLGGGTDQITATNNNLSPERSRNIEVGAKWDVIDQRLSLTAALFQTDKTNARVSDGLGGTINAGSQRVRGAELGWAGSLTNHWRVFGGYSYLNAITTDAGPGAAPGSNGLPMVMVPKHNLTLWTDYEVMPKFTVGAGMTLSSLTYASVSSTTRKWTPGYARFDAMATYRVSRTVDLQLNVQNIFDKKYYASAYPIYATWAPGRTAMLTLNFHQ
ncbi:TonB-dependent receptor [Pandoraea apista]|uniref:TonB-dependent siderophore receptor n=1 Tax=Pandoraea apista TaxID=93218 RepID=A0ABX9ZUQ0_9BURK|nr:TonB-dependent siderophore receptor [Pandoraea apista]PTD99977.1 TonB-dependent siderophore receptor [Pandoraea apista]RRJ31355.1 TonB-dependent siderophore receptor [Pandoraea apista]RRJ74029.1 TonB-dependent siderophore receptor [Pandoraea apista]RSC98091.1 TonB-dependent siderophore receptor [Pandoraea apista]RSD20491.1 TonB-dependent siderophore receptor [Pandoraea apista]